VKDQLDVLIHQLVEKGIRYDVASADFEKKYIVRVLERAKGNQSRAARILGMHRNTLSRKISEYNLEAANGKGPGRSSVAMAAGRKTA
jgi:DNA-binding protein Fis